MVQVNRNNVTEARYKSDKFTIANIIISKWKRVKLSL